MLACVAANVGYALAPRSVLLATSARTAVRAYRPNKLPWRMTTWLVRRATDRSRAVDALRALVVAGAGAARRETALMQRRPRAVAKG
jgi:DNA-binding transcriptional LysR family regulator